MKINLENLKQAIKEEYKAIDDLLEKEKTLSLNQQRKNGTALFPFKSLNVQHTNIGIEVQFNTSFAIESQFFRKGAAVLLKSATNQYVKGRIIDIELQQLTVQIKEDVEFSLEKDQLILHISSDDRTLKAMELGCEMPIKHPHVSMLLQEIESESQPAFSQSWDGLNEQQSLALTEILNDKNQYVPIQGPPGTGKTHLLVNALLKLIAKGKKIIVSAPSNTAVDHILKKLLEEKVTFIRFGNEEKIDEVIRPNTLESLVAERNKSIVSAMEKKLEKCYGQLNKQLHTDYQENKKLKLEIRKEIQSLRADLRSIHNETQQYIIASASVLAGTPVGLFNQLHAQFKADILIMDEAGQCSIPLTLLCASFAKRLVVCGDPQQLSPFVQSSTALKLGLGKSILDYSKQRLILLKEQYRMDHSILDTINPYFYEGQLKTTFNKAIGTCVFVDMSGYSSGEKNNAYNASYYNEEEVEIVEKIIEQHKLNPSTTLILSPYSAQLMLLQQKLGKAWRCMTIDAAQGQEEKNVIISLTRSNETFEIGFLKDYRRLNVAISRSQHACYLLGDSATLAKDNFYALLMQHLENTQSYQSAYEYLDYS